MRPSLRIIVPLIATQLANGAPYIIPEHGPPRKASPETPSLHAPPSQRDLLLSNTQAGTFTVSQVPNPNFPNRTGLESLVQAYAKFGGHLPPRVQHAVKINQNIRAPVKRGNMQGTVPASPPGYDYEFLSPVQIGTPPQTVYMNLDSGSADLWVFSSDTPKAQVSGQRIYTPNKSTTSSKLANHTWRIRYGDGSGASGIAYTDKVAVGKASFATQCVESATSVSLGFTSDHYSSGIFGLAMSEGNTVRPTRQQTFMDNIKSSLLSPVWTANLKRGVPGNYNFGYINTSEYTGAIQYAPIDTTSIFWQWVPTGYQIGKQAYVTAPWRAIADTGTTLLLLPDSIVKRYYAQIPKSAFDNYWGGILFPCTSAVPDFTFGYGNYRGLIPGRYINYEKVNATWCYGGIQSSEGIGFSIFGDIAIKAQFVVHDVGNKRIGWANKKLTT